MDGIWLECETPEAADTLRVALNEIGDIKATGPLLKNDIVDGRLIVEVVIIAGVTAKIIAPEIVRILAGLGYNRIKISGKVTILNVASVEGAIEADRSGSDEGRK